MTTESITAIVDNVFELVPVDMLRRISAIHYYGAGVVSAEQRVSISMLLGRLSSTAILETHSDMLGAAALCSVIRPVSHVFLAPDPTRAFMMVALLLTMYLL